jgi:hypothetical protein
MTANPPLEPTPRFDDGWFYFLIAAQRHSVSHADLGRRYFRVVMKIPAYLALALKSQDICFARTSSYLDEDAECLRVLDKLSRCLARIESWATCTDGCHGGDHLLERLSTRVIGHAAASVRLVFNGH